MVRDQADVLTSKFFLITSEIDENIRTLFLQSLFQLLDRLIALFLTVLFSLLYLHKTSAVSYLDLYLVIKYFQNKFMKMNITFLVIRIFRSFFQRNSHQIEMKSLD